MWSTRATLPEIFGKKGVPKVTMYSYPTFFFGDIKGLYVLCVCVSFSLRLCTLATWTDLKKFFTKCSQDSDLSNSVFRIFKLGEK